MSVRSDQVGRRFSMIRRNRRGTDEGHQDIERAVSHNEFSAVQGRVAEGSVAGRDEQANFWDLISNRNFHPDDTLDFLKQFERGADTDVQKTYQRTQLTRVDFDAPKPKVGLVFLPGADKPTVTRLEEFSMSQQRPAQRDPAWRVNTTGSLLSTWTVDKDLSFITSDLTRRVLDRMKETDGTVDKITVHSEKVKVVEHLKTEQGQPPYDLSATLIEVDASSLIKLITQFRYLLKQSTPSMMPTHHVNHLEDMMEAARVFYSRCPILFRMGTRKHIIYGNDIRYGIDDESGFKTIYPSAGIQQILSVSAAFFNALDVGTFSKDKAHATVRPRFLQMLVLLLSMLGEANICQMAEFLEQTYKIKSNRADLELLFLKTIPLSSINPKVFLSSLIPAVFGRPMPMPGPDDDKDGWDRACWKYLLQELAKKGYLLPATFEELGRETQTWLPAWPKEGHRSSRCFGRLQLHGNEPRGFNEILPFRVEADAEAPKLKIYLANTEEPYFIDTIDYENVVNLQPGTYYIRKDSPDGSIVPLSIRVETLTDPINEAVQFANKAISLNNEYARDVPNNPKKLSKLVNFRNAQTAKLVLSEMPKFPEITRHEVWLGDNTPYLVVAWKCGGRTISQGDMLARMSRAGNRVGAVVHAFVRNNPAQIRMNEQAYARLGHLMSSHAAMMEHERSTNGAGHNGRVSDTPIKRTVHPRDDKFGVNLDIWYDYEVNFKSEWMLLFIWSQRDTVVKVIWMDDQATIELETSDSKLKVSPLRSELETSPEEEVREGDTVLLCGRYIIIVGWSERVPPKTWEEQPTYEMVNWMEIQGISEGAHRRRHRNQVAPEQQLTVIL